MEPNESHPETERSTLVRNRYPHIDRPKCGFMLYTSWVVTILMVINAIVEWCGINGELFLASILFLYWLMIPLVVLWIAGFVMSWFQKHKYWKRLRWAWIGSVLILAATSHGPKNRDIVEYMAETYEEHSAELKELIIYTDEACDSACYLRLEWEGRTLASCSYAYRPNDLSQKGGGRGKEAILQETGITHEELENIRKMAKKCNCIGIEIDKRVKRVAEEEMGCYSDVVHLINFQRRGMGMYSFQLFDEGIDSTQANEIADDTHTIRYNDSTYFLFEGGAIGTNSWDSDYKQEKELQFKNNHK